MTTNRSFKHWGKIFNNDTTVAAAAAAGVAWIYDQAAGTVTANGGTADDASGKLYTAY